MPQMNFDLEDGKPPVSFSIRADDCARFVAFMAECEALRKAGKNIAMLRAALVGLVGADGAVQLAQICTTYLLATPLILSTVRSVPRPSKPMSSINPRFTISSAVKIGEPLETRSEFISLAFDPKKGD